MIDNCLFCKIAAKSSPAEIIYEDQHAMAFLDIYPMTPGHAIIIPKNHAKNIIDLPDIEASYLIIAVKKVTALLEAKLAPRGFTIGINHGKESGQAIEHLHIHIIPRYKGDGGGSIHSVVQYSQGESFLDIKKRLL